MSANQQENDSLRAILVERLVCPVTYIYGENAKETHNLFPKQ